MTREEAIEAVKSAFDAWEYQYDTGDDWSREHEARDMAIKALKQQPCEDCISRQAVLEYIEGEEAELGHSSENELVRRDINELPSVTPQPKIGKWIAQDIYNCHTDFRCSECGYIHSFMHLYGEPTADYTYCPNCGSKMEVK